MEIIKELQNLTYLQWSHARSSSGTAGTFLKSESTIDGKKTYYKLSNYNPVDGVVGHECINEIIVDRLLTVLGVEHLDYKLIHANVFLENKIIETYLCASTDFKQRGESKIALDDFYYANAIEGEGRYEFCERMGWRDYIDCMLVIDFIIQNRDRHGANIEVLRNARAHTLRIAPLFDHGLSLLYSCTTDAEIEAFDIFQDRKCQNYIGGYSTLDNLKLIKSKEKLFNGKLTEQSKDFIFDGLDGVLSKEHLDKIWQMIFERYMYYENL